MGSAESSRSGHLTGAPANSVPVCGTAYRIDARGADEQEARGTAPHSSERLRRRREGHGATFVCDDPAA
jgi:hypothetical protein